MEQIQVYHPETGLVVELPLGFTKEDIAQLSAECLYRFNYFVVDLTPTTDIWKDRSDDR